MNGSPRTLLLAATLPALLAGSGCAAIDGTSPAAILERVGDGEYDVGIRYPSKRARYVMIVEEDEESFTLVNRQAVASRDADPGTVRAGAPEPVVPQRNDRVLAPCTESAGSWYRHTPAGYVCVGESATPGSGG